jgi:glycosyltransferase involved in cell wall biosynthesis
VDVLVVATWFPSKDSPTSGIFNLRDVELLARDHRVTVVHLASVPLTDDIDDIEVLKNKSFELHRIPFSPSAPHRFGAAHRALKPFLANAQLLHTMAFSALLPFVGRKVDLPWVHTEHWSGITEPAPSVRGVLSQAVLKRTMKRPDVFVVVSELLKSHIIKFRRRDTEVIGNFVSLPSSLPPRAESASVGLVAVGGLIERKGPLVAVAATKFLLDAGLDAHLTWVGEGNQRQAAEKLAAEIGISDRIHLVGNQPVEKVGAYLGNADLFIMPTINETFGVAIAEAMAFGLPVVVGALGGFRDFIHPRASRVVPDRTGAAFGAAALDLLQDPHRLTRTEIAADASEKFDEGFRQARYASVYNAACQNHF